MYNKVKNLIKKLGGFRGDKSKARVTQRQDTRTGTGRKKVGSVVGQTKKLPQQKKTNSARKGAISRKTTVRERVK